MGSVPVPSVFMRRAGLPWRKKNTDPPTAVGPNGAVDVGPGVKSSTWAPPPLGTGPPCAVVVSRAVADAVRRLRSDTAVTDGDVGLAVLGQRRDGDRDGDLQPTPRRARFDTVVCEMAVFQALVTLSSKSSVPGGGPSLTSVTWYWTVALRSPLLACSGGASDSVTGMLGGQFRD